MRRKTTLVLLLIGYCVGLFVSPAKGEEIFDIFYSDGQVHIIDSPMNDTRAFCEGEFTTVDVVEGGSLFELHTLDNARGLLSGGTIFNLFSFNSYVSISGGTVFNELNAYGNSQVEMSGGAIGYWDEYFIDGILHAYMDSQIMVSGGWISHLLATDESQVSISGDTTIGFVGARESGQVTVYGGTIRELAAIENGQVTVYGMSMSELSNVLVAENEGIMTFYGSEFYVDFQQVGYGEITSIFGGHIRDEPKRDLVVRFDNGEFFGAQFYIGHNASIVLVPEPAPPIADAGTNQTVTDIDDNGSEQVTLDGSGSSDSDGSIVSWVWTDDLGDTIPDGEIVSATLSVGVHTITLTVTNDDDLTDTNSVTVTVEPCPSEPPDANANGPYVIYVGDTLTLDASGSTDADADIVSYMWDLDDDENFEMDAGEQAVFDVNYVYLQSLGLIIDNTYNIHVQVTDSEGQSDVADSTLIIVPRPATVVAVDIKPGSCPNPVNVKSSGVLPVAILGTADFDANTIDATSVRLAGVEPLRNSIEDVAAPVSDFNDCNCITDGPDGFLDLTLKFKTQRIVEAVGDVNDGDELQLELIGVLFDETPIEGADCILIRGRHKPISPADINKDGVVNAADFAIFAQNWLQSSIVDE